MTVTPFDPLDKTTWPLVMTTRQVAAIYQRAVGGLRKCCQRHVFMPAPYRERPYLWRKKDVLLDIDGPTSLRKVS